MGCATLSPLLAPGQPSFREVFPRPGPEASERWRSHVSSRLQPHRSSSLIIICYLTAQRSFCRLPLFRFTTVHGRATLFSSAPLPSRASILHIAARVDSTSQRRRSVSAETLNIRTASHRRQTSTGPLPSSICAYLTDPAAFRLCPEAEGGDGMLSAPTRNKAHRG